MKIDYRELVSELKNMTTVDGFISTCLEFKENMLFYDRDLVLAAYASTVELLAVSALFSASLESDEAAKEVEDAFKNAVSDLPKQFSTLSLPLDVQNLGEYYTRGAGWVLTQRYPVYLKMFALYRQDAYEPEKSVDELIRKAHLALADQETGKMEEILGLVGAKLLRGDRLRPIWFRTSHPRIQIILTGLQTLVNNFTVASYFTFPFEDIATERQKRTKVSGNVVLDLGAFRNFRRGIGGFTDRRIVVEPDEVDKLLEKLLDGGDENAVSEEQRIYLTEILVSVAEVFSLNDDADPTLIRRVLGILVAWNKKEAGELAVRLLPTLDPWDPIFQYCMLVLKQLELDALPAIRKFVRANQDSSLLPIFADIIASGRKSKRRFQLLREIFHTCSWGQSKELVCYALARYGGEEAREILQKTLDSIKEEDTNRRIPVKEALKLME